ncbi:MAG: hypothetical protein R3Y24_02750 [Eubacteriales bacterium]
MKKLIILILLISTILTACTPKAPPPPTMVQMEQMLEEKYEEEFTVTSQSETQKQINFTGYTAYPKENPEFEFQAWQYTVITISTYPEYPNTHTGDSYQEVMFWHHFENLLIDNQYLYTYEERPLFLGVYQKYLGEYEISIALDIETKEEFYEKLAKFLKDGENKDFVEIIYSDDKKYGIYPNMGINLNNDNTFVIYPNMGINIYYIKQEKVYKERLWFGAYIIKEILKINESSPLSAITTEFIKDKFSNSNEINDCNLKDEEKELIIKMLENYPEILKRYELEE